MKGFRKLPKKAQRPRSWFGSLHRLLGVWSLAFIPVIGITVVWYLLEWNDTIVWEEYKESTEHGLLADARSVDGTQIDRWIAVAKEAHPEMKVANIWLPYSSGEAVSLTGQADAALVRERANEVVIDPITGEVASVKRAREMGWQQRWTHTADPLHFGGFGGLWTKIIWFLSGLALAVLSFSGVAIYCLRNTGKKEVTP